MAQEIYLSVGVWDPERKQYINPKTKEPTIRMRYRGQTGPHDDPEGYKRRMRRAGCKVDIRSGLFGTKDPKSGQIEYDMQEVHAP